MSDNTQLNQMADGDTIVTEDIGENPLKSDSRLKLEVTKLRVGAEGQVGKDVSQNDPLPILSASPGTPIDKSIQVNNETEGAVVEEGLVTRVGTKFMLNGRPYRFFGGNQYSLHGSFMSQAALAEFFNYCKLDGVGVVRFWAFNQSGTSGAFHTLSYPDATGNVITNTGFETNTTGWTLDAPFTRSNEDASTGTWSIKQVSAVNTYDRMSYTATVTASTDYTWSFWYKLTHTPGASYQLGPVAWVRSAGGADHNLADGGILNASATWVKKTVNFNSGANTSITIDIINYGGENVAFYDDFILGTPSASPPVMASLESGYVQLDLVLDEARKAGIRLIPSFFDSNEFNINSKKTYIDWINATIPGKNLPNGVGTGGSNNNFKTFFTDTDVKNLFKSHLAEIITRTNTINGRKYNEDPTIFAWELGNEIRYNYGEANANTLNSVGLLALSGPGGWADQMSTYIKSIDSNHLVSFGDAGHGYAYTALDAVWNGTIYGVDYNMIASLPNIDYLDFHLYPNQSNGNGFGYNVGGGTIWGWGVHLGFPFVSANHPSGAGFRAQIQDYVHVAHANGKPVICGETSLEKEYHPVGDYPLYPRVEYLKQFLTDTFDYSDSFGSGLDGFLWWSVSFGNAGFELYLKGYDPLGNQDIQYDDRPMIELFKARTAQYAQIHIQEGVADQNIYLQDVHISNDGTEAGYIQIKDSDDAVVVDKQYLPNTVENIALHFTKPRKVATGKGIKVIPSSTTIQPTLDVNGFIK